MVKTSAAIVLHVIKYNDSSNIVKLFTESDGVMTFIISNSYTKKSRRNKAFFSPLSILEVVWDDEPKRKLPRLKNVNCLYPYQRILIDPYKMTMVLFLSEFLYLVLREEQVVNVSLFTFIKYSLQWLEESVQGFSNFHIVFMLKLSQFLGFQPNLEDYQKGTVFDLVKGKFSATYPTHHYYIKEEDAAFLLQLYRVQYASIKYLKLTHEQRNSILEAILTYYRLHIPNMPEMKSLPILKEIFFK